MRISLFVELESKRLERVEFQSCQSSETRVCIRSKELSGFPDATGTFQWTPGAKALVVLLARYVLHGSGVSSVVGANLRGGAGSLAASLDSSLSKQPAWLLDMFGVHASGRAVARSIIKRVNPERKRGGEVILLVNHQLLPISGVRFYSVHERALGAEEISALCASLSSERSSATHTAQRAAISGSERPSNGVQAESSTRFDFAADVAHEISEMLWSTDIFSRTAYRASYRKWSQFVCGGGGVGNRLDLLPDIDRQLTEAGLLGLRHSRQHSVQLESVAPIRVATGAAAFASIAVIQHMAHLYRCPIEIDYEHVNTRTLIREIASWSGPEKPPDAVVVSVSCAAMFFQSHRRHEYVPVMILPGNSHRTVRSKELHASGHSFNEWTFISDEPTTSSFYLDDLFSSESSRSFTKRCTEQYELLSSACANSEDFQAVLWYPHYRFQQILNGHQVCTMPSQAWHYTGNVLFVRRDRCDELGVALNIAIRDSWLDLREKPDVIRAISARFMGIETYRRILYRTSGLFYYRELTSDSLGESILPRYSYQAEVAQ